jgi:hypothetical protein
MASPSRGQKRTAQKRGFQAPTAPASTNDEDTREQFEAPPGGHPGKAGEDMQSVLFYDVSDELLTVKQDLESAIFARSHIAASSALGDEPPDLEDLVVGVGIGPAHRDFESVGSRGPGAPVLNVYVTERIDMDGAKRILVDTYRARAFSRDSQPVNVIFTGPIDALAHRHRERAAPCGISVGHFKITAGTQGALARGRSGERAHRLLILSNNHVLANSNDAAAGDAIIQPGPADRGNNPADRIAILERWVPIDFAGAPNLVDCATAWCWPDLVRPDFIRGSGSGWSYFQVGTTVVNASINLAVGKSGRTTQLTSGRVIDTNASIRVNFGKSGVGNFTDQITIRGNHGQFSQGGDSGSLIWTWDGHRNPVGLLFAGGGEFTFANKIQHVLDALDIDLHT